MAENSKIEWCKHTLNFFAGCSHQLHFDGTPRPACIGCYAEAWARRTGGKSQPPLCEWGDDKPRHRTSEKIWNNAFKWNHQQAVAGERANVFVNSLSDIFDVADPRLHEWRREAFAIMAKCTNLNWMLLTKRIDLAFHCLSRCLPIEWRGKLPSHIWLGITVENQQAFDEQWPIFVHALQVFGVGRSFFSMEPLFEPVSIVPALQHPTNKLSMAILGGASGPACKETNLDYMMEVAETCWCYKTPVFIKQMGAKPVWKGNRLTITDQKGGLLEEMPGRLQRREWPEGTFLL